MIQRLALRRFLDLFGEALREATLLLTAKSSSFAPAFNCSRSQTGCAPLPAHVFPDLSRNLTATFRPFRELPRTFLLEPICCPSFESSSRNRAALWARTSAISSRSFNKASRDAELRLGFGIGESPAKANVNHTTSKTNLELPLALFRRLAVAPSAMLGYSR